MKESGSKFYSYSVDPSSEERQNLFDKIIPSRHTTLKQRYFKVVYTQRWNNVASTLLLRLYVELTLKRRCFNGHTAFKQRRFNVDWTSWRPLYAQWDFILKCTHSPLLLIIRLWNFGRPFYYMSLCLFVGSDASSSLVTQAYLFDHISW